MNMRKILTVVLALLFAMPIAAAFAEDISETARAGMNGHLSKPIDIDNLKSTLSKYLK